MHYSFTRTYFRYSKLKKCRGRRRRRYTHIP
jgi:hypothetical protein